MLGPHATEEHTAMAWHIVCATDELPTGQKKAVSVDGQRIVVYHLEDGFFATQASCTHMFAPLERGKLLDNCIIQCPFHRARFDIRSGDVVDWANFPPGIQVLNVIRGEKGLKTYRTRVSGSSVQVEVARSD
jgi:3-phenylpropionate/trans-cinnamate dioxygenase ferredoxin subunit